MTKKKKREWIMWAIVENDKPSQVIFHKRKTAFKWADYKKMW